MSHNPFRQNYWTGSQIEVRKVDGGYRVSVDGRLQHSLFRSARAAKRWAKTVPDSTSYPVMPPANRRRVL
jgi:hypothetical protein